MLSTALIFFPVAVGILHGIAAVEDVSVRLPCNRASFSWCRAERKVGHDAPAAVDRLAAGVTNFRLSSKWMLSAEKSSFCEVTIVDVVSVVRRRCIKGFSEGPWAL